jgi:type IV secretory pathway TrbL component
VLAIEGAFMLVAAELLLTLVKAYLTTGLGVILLGFDGNRYTASASEGYFTNVIRIGVKLLLFYAVLAIVAQWEASLAATRKPVAKTVPLIASY